MIALGVILIVASALLRDFFVLPFVQEQLRNLAASQQMSMATYIARDIDHSLVARRQLISELADALPLELLQQPQELTQWIKERQRLNQLFNGGFLAIRPDGSGIGDGYPAVNGRDKLSFSKRDWFQSALTSDGVAMSRPQLGRASHGPMIIMAAPIRDANHHVVAVLAGVARLNAPGFLDRLQETSLGKSGSFLLISPADRLFVDASDPSMILAPTPAPGVNLLHDRAMAGYRGTGVTINQKGIEELSAIASVPSVGWFVVARMPTSEAFSLIGTLRGVIWKSSFLALVGIVVTLLFFLPRIFRPLTDTAKAIRDMANGKRELEALPIRREDEVGSLIIGFNYLVTRLREKEAALKISQEHMQFMAHHDSLTGLYNRAILEDRLQLAIAQAERTGSRFALLFCDLDCFKEINDEYGHEVGDAVLVCAAKRLAQGRRRIDTVARLGGDEFVILLTELDDARATALHVAQQYLATISAPCEVGDKTFAMNVSIGISVYQGTQISSSQLLSQADIALFEEGMAEAGSSVPRDDSAPSA